MTLTKRVELLFDPSVYERLEEMAKSRGESVASLIRSAVESQYLQPTLEQKRAAVQRIVSQNIDVGPWEEVKSFIEEEVAKSFESIQQEAVEPFETA